MKNNKYYFIPMVGRQHKALGVDLKRDKTVIKLSKDIKKWLNDNNGSFSEPFITAYAVSHCQIGLTEQAKVVPIGPFAFFIVNKQFLNKKESSTNYSWPDQIIYNPEILETPETVTKDVPTREVSKDHDGNVSYKIVKKRGKVSNLYEVPEGCMSFQHKKEKKMMRYHTIKVKYQTRGFFGQIRTHEEWIEGLKAHIFQHEMDHMEGNNIYFNHKRK